MSTITAALSKIRSSKKNTPKHKRRDNMPTTSSPKSSNQSQSSQISRKSLEKKEPPMNLAIIKD